MLIYFENSCCGFGFYIEVRNGRVTYTEGDIWDTEKNDWNEHLSLACPNKHGPDEGEEGIPIPPDLPDGNYCWDEIEGKWAKN